MVPHAAILTCFGWRIQAPVFIHGFVLILFITTEGRRMALPLLWLPIVATLVVGVSLGLPLVLFLRQRQLDANAPALT
jgi:hypothetical protein